MKSELEKRFDAVAKQYSDTFGENYPLQMFNDHPLTYHIARMEQSIKDNKPVPDPQDALEGVFED